MAQLIIDCHGHYTTAPATLQLFRNQQIAHLEGSRPAAPDPLHISDDQLRETIQAGQIRLQKERGIDFVIFSPRAGSMGHHVGDHAANSLWSRICNDLIFRITQLFPKNFAGVCQLPQVVGVSPANCVAELERCVNELGFVGCNLNPDPSGGHWKDPPLTDRFWYPLYEKMVELDVPAMVHVSASCNPCFNGVGAHYINGDTTAFMQFLTADLFKDFPTLKFVIPHGGGAVPYHWGRYTGLAIDLARPPIAQLLDNVFFDTCVYHQPGIDLLVDVIPPDNVLFASEMIGAVRSRDPRTGHYFEDTKRYLESARLSAEDRRKIYETNARKVYNRLNRLLA